MKSEERYSYSTSTYRYQVCWAVRRSDDHPLYMKDRNVLVDLVNFDEAVAVREALIKDMNVISWVEGGY